MYVHTCLFFSFSFYRAENALRHFATQPGLAFSLLQILANASVNTQLRHMAGVLLRQHIGRNWVQDDDEEEEEEEDHVATDYNPETGEIEQVRIKTSLSSEHTSFLQMKRALVAIPVAEEEKNQIKSALAPLLADTHSEIRTCVCMIIAAIAEHDVDSWPELIPGLISALSSSNPVLIVGALRCFTLLTEDFTGSTFGPHVRQLFAVLATLSGPKSPVSPAIKAGALALYSAVIVSYTVTEDPQDRAFEKKHAAVLLPTLSELMGICNWVLDQPFPSSLTGFSAAESMFEFRAEAINVFITLIAYFPKLMRTHLVTLTGIVERAATAALPFFDLHVIRHRYTITSGVQSEHPLAGLAQLMANALAFYSLLVDSPLGAGKHLRTRLASCYAVVGSLLQLTEADCEDLREDVGQFAELENEVSDYDGSSMKSSILRKQAIIFVCQSIEAWPRSAGDAAANEVSNLCRKAHTTASTGDSMWWKYLEAGAMLTGQLLTNIDAFVKQTILPLPIVLQHVILPSLSSTKETFAQNMGASMGGSAIDIASEELCFLRARGAWLIGLVSLPITSGALAAMSAFSDRLLASPTSKKAKNVAAAAADPSGERAGRAVAESRDYLAKLLPMLVQCLSPHADSLVQVSAAVSFRLAGVGLANLDLSAIELTCLCAKLTQSGRAVQPPFSTDSLLAPIFSPLLEGLGSVLAGGDSGGALHCALETLCWAVQAAASWEASRVELSSPGRYGDVARTVFDAYDSRGMSIVVYLSSLAGSIVNAVLRCWTANFSDPVVAENAVDIIKALTAIPSCAAEATGCVLPAVLSVLSRPVEEVPAGVRMIALEMVSVVLRNTAPGWAARPTDVYSSSSSSGSVLAHVTPLVTIQSVAATVSGPFAFRHAPGATALSGQEVVERLLPLVLQVGATASSDESWLIQGSCALTSTIFAIYGPVIAGNAAYAPLAKGAAELAFRLLRAKDSDMSETAIAPVARLLTQLLVNVGSTPLIDEATKVQLFNLALTRVVNSRTHTLTVALLLFFCRAIVQNPTTVFSLLATRGTLSMMVEKVTEKPVKAKKGAFKLTAPKTKVVTTQELVEVSALQAFINILASRATDFHSAYACKVVFTAIARMLCDSDCLRAISPLMVDGPEAFDFDDHVMTRSKTAVKTKIPTAPVPAVPTLIALLSEAVARAVENKLMEEDRKTRGVDFDDEEGLFAETDDENEAAEYNEDETDAAAVVSAAQSKARSIFADAEGFENGTMNLSDMLDFEELGGGGEGYDRFGDQEDFPEFIYDLLDQVDLGTLGVSTIKSLPVELITSVIPLLSAEQREPLQKILTGKWSE